MHLSRRSLLAGAAAAGLVWALPHRASALPVYGGRAFGSYWRLVTGETGLPGGAAGDILAVIRDVDRAMSPWRAGSEISRINRAEGTDWLPLSEGLARVTRAALDLARASGGAFDPTVGPVVGRYGFGPIRGRRVGDAGDLGLRDGALRKGKAGLTLDLCGIAKGWALDRIVAALDARGVRDFLFELGGEVAARGAHPAGRPWRVAIDNAQAALALDRRAVATSGPLAQGYRVGARQYGHIIDPHRGAPASGELVSVSVIADTATGADGWATALYSAGPDAAQAMAEAQGLSAVLVIGDGAAGRIVTAGDAGRLLLR